MTGTLYVVSTPIGNLGDLTDRAREVLASVTAIACEDTRTTGKLLRHFGIGTKTLSYHEHNEAERAPELVSRLSEGHDVALVCDAGTPLISDPGYRLIRAARAADVPVRSLPGPSAVLAALVVSGMPTSPFTFFGFLPARGASRENAVRAAANVRHTVVLFEAPTRIARLLDELAALCGKRPACLLRELTKLHEEQRAGTLAELASWARGRTFKGELSLVLGPAEDARRPEVSLEDVAPRYRELRAQGLSAREASKKLAAEYGFTARDVYNRFAK